MNAPSTGPDTPPDAPRISFDPDSSRWEAHVGARLAGYADAAERDGVVVFPHTLVDPAFEGRGIGSALARASLDDARERGLSVRPACTFYSAWIARHPEYADLVA
ncbi:GNAT family N-acetyltransferase [Agilicoccus flavus]|uniref:GNAT family N-acetyltransferase n=1 Tax=Agilicoccus flavus TaxID=2775968 RepID=UPI001CF6DDAD|nr:GNAT family N-acetyltransferase [Agilicoccus flavus]